jgi:sugar lactone lactonase YvrE
MKLIYSISALCLAAMTPIYGLPPIITTVAGSGRHLLGLGGPATQVNLGETGGVARDSVGNLYVSDRSYHGVLKITAAGIATIVAGKGVPEFSGDNGPATQAGLNSPGSLLFDAANNLYIADENNNRIRRVTPSGIITTFAGGGPDVNQPPVEGVLATNTFVSPNGLAIDIGGNIYVSDWNHNIVRKIRNDSTVVTVIGNGIRGFSGDNGPATSASIDRPTGLAIDSVGNLYMADFEGRRIRKVTTDGIIHTIAGTGQTGLTGDGGPAINATIDLPMDLFINNTGDLYISSLANNVVRKISASDGIINTIVGNGAYGFSGDGGPALNATLKGAVSLVIDGAQNIYVSDRYNSRVRKVDNSGTISTFAGNGAGNSSGDGGAATSVGLNRPSAVAFDSSGNMYIADAANHRIRKVTTQGAISTIAGTGNPGFSGDNGPAVNAMLDEPQGIAADINGNIYIADTRNSRVRQINKNLVISTYAGSGNTLGDGGPATNANVGQTRSIAVDQVGNLFIADPFHARIRRVNTSGIITTIAGNGQFGYGGDGGLATNASINPYAVAVESNGSVYISGPSANPSHVRKVDSQGIITRFAGDDGQGCDLGGPQICLATQVTYETCINVAFDGHGGYFVGSEGFSLVTQVASNNIASSLVHSDQGGAAGFSGDGGPALTAFLYHPGGLATDAAGDLYIADTVNDWIRKVQMNPPVFANISTRLSVGIDTNVLIGGFIINGTQSKKVIVRAIGPSLTQFGVPGALADPILELHDNTGALIGTNDNWQTTQIGGVITADQVNEIQNSGLAPRDPAESVIIASLQPGGYTGIVRGKNNTTGVALVEGYDGNRMQNSKLANISTRGLVQTGSDVMIGGLIVQGNNPARMIVRAIGPSLTQFGIPNALPDPTLELHDGNGVLLASNDNWRSDQEAEILATGLAPANNLESAIVRTLPPSGYTAIVRDRNNLIGVGLVEAYQLSN